MHMFFLMAFFLGNKCFQVNIFNVESGVTFWKARRMCRMQSGIRADVASFDNDLENGMNLSFVIFVYNGNYLPTELKHYYIYFVLSPHHFLCFQMLSIVLRFFKYSS